MSPKVTDEYKLQRRADILLAARNVFVKKGFEPTSISDIAQEAGVSRATVYEYFSSTDEIFANIIEHVQVGIISQIHDGSRGKSAWKSIELFMEEEKSWIHSSISELIPVFIEYMVISWRDAKKREQLIYKYKRFNEFFTSILKMGVEQGELTPKVPLGLIVGFTNSAINGIVMNRLNVGEDLMDFEKEMDLLIDFLKDTLQVRK